MEVIGDGAQEADLAAGAVLSRAQGAGISMDIEAEVEFNRGHAVVVSSHSVNESERLPRLRRGRSCGSAHSGNPRPNERQPHLPVNPADAWPTVRRRQP